MLDERISPYVPAGALDRPEGAAIQHGMVKCIACEKMLPVANADIVGMGYRCVPCSQQASIAKLTGGGDAAAHFTDIERAGLRDSGAQVIWFGGGAILIGVVLFLATMVRTGTAAVLIGVIAIAIGLARRNASK